METVTVNGQRLLSPAEVSERIGVTVKRLGKWRVLGKPELEFIKCGKSVKYRPEIVEAFLLRNTAKKTGHGDAA